MSGTEDMTLLDYMFHVITNALNDVYAFSQDIYHYTSPDGLMGILKPNHLTFRFTNANYLNDTSEGEDVVKQYRFVCDEMLREKRITQEFYAAIKDVRPNNKMLFPDEAATQNGKKHYSSYESDAYLCCFSLDPDSLPMWNYYVKGNVYQGYNLGISDRFIHDIRASEPFVERYKVIYDDKEKQKKIQNFLETIYAKMSEAESIHTIQDYIGIFLSKYRYVFKNCHFEHEKEVRAVIYRKKDIHQEDIKFRSANGLIIPYVELDFDRHNLHHVTIGPLMEQGTAYATLATFLYHRGYRPRIAMSGVPIRY